MSETEVQIEETSEEKSEESKDETKDGTQKSYTINDLTSTEKELTLLLVKRFLHIITEEYFLE